jgi:hypothetical protein
MDSAYLCENVCRRYRFRNHSLLLSHYEIFRAPRNQYPPRAHLHRTGLVSHTGIQAPRHCRDGYFGMEGRFYHTPVLCGHHFRIDHPSTYPGQNLALAAICCMAAINSCVTRTPISTIILLSTLTGFAYFVPIMFASLTGFFLAPKTPFIGSQLDKE